MPKNNNAKDKNFNLNDNDVSIEIRELKRERNEALEQAKNATNAMLSVQEQYDIINALSDDYLNIYSVHPEKNSADVIKLDGYVIAGINANSKALDYSKVLGKYIESRVYPDDRENFTKVTSIKNVIETLSANKKFDFTYRTFVDGEIHYFSVRYTRVSKLDEKMRVIAGFRNVDSIVNAERKYHDVSEEAKAFAAIHSSLGSGYWGMKFNEKGEMNKVIWSEKFRKMLGYNDENDFPDVLESWTDLIHPDFKENVMKCFWNTINDWSGETNYDVAYLLLTKNRGWRWFHDACKVVRRSDGSPEALHGVFIEIDEQKKNEEKLKDALVAAEKANQAQALSAIHESLGSGYWTMTFNEKAEMTSCTWSDKFREMIGYNDENDFPNELESWSNLLHSSDKKRILAEYWDTVNDFSGKKTYDVEYRLLTKNRGYRWFHAAGKLTRRSDASPDTFYGVFIDIDEQKCNEKALQDALMAAEKANRAKTTFLNNMSHDIRTPMNAIIGFTTLAATHIDDSETIKSYLEKIQISSNHLLSLINDVLDMSRIESGKVTIEEKETSLPEILHDLKTIVQSDIISRQLEFFIDTVDVVNENVICDKLRLNQILLNLMTNAMKFTRPGGLVALRVVQLTGSRDGYASYKFEVKDTGIGISKGFLSHVFEPFEREKTSTVSGIQGTGLGLAITKNIVDMMGGRIEVDSIPNRGTTFTVYLKLKTNGNPTKHEVIPALKGLRALVVDDDFDTCASVTKMLVTIGMRPDWTTYGKEAILRAGLATEQGDAYAAYIIDYLMPDMNGIEVVRRIRRKVGDDAPIIVLSAYDWSDIEEEAREAGVTAFCSKPIFLSELREILESPFEAKPQVKNDEISDFSGKSVLLVEDNALNREIAIAILKKASFVVDVAENGEIAVNKIAKNPPHKYDVVLMDVQMPVMNGYEATKQIRAFDDSEKANIPIIAMTANAFDEDKQEALAIGMNDYILKPINIHEMMKTLEKAVKGK